MATPTPTVVPVQASTAFEPGLTDLLDEATAMPYLVPEWTVDSRRPSLVSA
ncbi:MAG: hypothetical protein JWO93_1766 [Micrococcaceae bacterium]|nr:hypothetical protein [Micrococcaceae bacterium]